MNDDSFENLSDDELLTIIREAENTDVSGSRYQKANAEWQIRHQQKMVDATKSNQNGPSFIKIAPGAKVKGLKLHNNRMIGNGDFIRNEGELEDADLKQNVHITSQTTLISKKKHGWLVSILLNPWVVGIGVGLILYFVFHVGQ